MILQTQPTAPAVHDAQIWAMASPPGIPEQASVAGFSGLSAARSGRVLIVDDSAVERTHMRSILTNLGMQVLEASSGREALEIASREQPEMIFLDIIMEDMDGFNACRELNSQSETSHIPVVMVSSKNNRADKVWATEQGAKGYITKPATQDDISAALGLAKS